MQVAHFNHNLRGADARLDAALVRQMARGLALPFHERTAPRQDRAEPSEAVLREQRWEFLLNLRASGAIAGYFVGQQADDVAETLLMRMARGSSSRGLAAPRPVQLHAGEPARLRPLLGIRRGELITTLRKAGTPWREDGSNADSRYTRNRLRRRVLPELEAALPQDLVAGLACSRAWLDEEDEALEAWLARLCPGLNRLDRLPRGPFQAQPRALWRRALTRWLDAQGLASTLSRAARETLLSAWEAGRPWRCSAGTRFIVCGSAGLSIESAAVSRDWPPVALGPGNTLFLTAGGALSWRLERVEDSLRADILGGGPDPARTAFVALRTDEPPPTHLLVRQWRSGDRFRPLGHPGTAKVQDLFTDRKIPAVERKRLPIVLRSDGEVIWIPGFPPPERCKVERDTVLAMRLTYENV